MANAPTPNAAPEGKESPDAFATRVWRELLKPNRTVGNFEAPERSEYLVCPFYRTERGSHLDLRLYGADGGKYFLYANDGMGPHYADDLRLLAEKLLAAGVNISRIGIQGAYAETTAMTQAVDGYASHYKVRMLESAGESTSA